MNRAFLQAKTGWETPRKRENRFIMAEKERK